MFPNIQDLWAKSRGKLLQGISQEQVPPRDGLLAKYVEIKAVVNDNKGLFLEFYDNPEQNWITFDTLRIEFFLISSHHHQKEPAQSILYKTSFNSSLHL